MGTDQFEEFVRSTDALFHYTRAATALEHILPEGKLRLSLLKDTNDPREYKFRLLQMSGWSLPDEIEKLYSDAHPVFDRIIRHQCRTACFCSNSLPTIVTDGGVPVQDVHASSTGWAKSRMWSQYGDGHYGVCLVFAMSALQDVLKSLSLSPGWPVSGAVTYMKRECIPRSALSLDGNRLADAGVEDYCSQHISERADALFLTKHVDYRDESEYRFVVFDPDGSHEFVDVRPAIRGVIAGDRTPEVYYPLLKNLASRCSATARRLYWSDGKPHLMLLKEERT